MKNKIALWPIYILVISMFLAWGSWGLVYNQVSVFSSPNFAIPAFYLTEFFVSFTTFASFATMIKFSLFERENLDAYLQSSIRQSIIFAIFIAIITLFQHFRLLNYSILIIVAMMAFFIEAFFWTNKNNHV